MKHATPRYLHAKETVDGRAYSRRVRETVQDELPPSPRVVEAGAGTGVMVSRLLSWGVTRGVYRGIDAAEPIVSHARDVRPAVCHRRGETVVSTPGEGWQVADLDCRFLVGDALDLAGGQYRGGADLVVAQSFLDLVDGETAIDAFADATAPGGVVYAPITFDGVTLFQPDHPADAAVERAFHAAIDDRPGRDSRAGRHLLELGRERGDLLAVDGADWVVRPRNGTYRADERYFLGRILDFVADALADRPVEDGDEWLATRRRQLAAGELTYVAHNYDLLFRP